MAGGGDSPQSYNTYDWVADPNAPGGYRNNGVPTGHHIQVGAPGDGGMGFDLMNPGQIDLSKSNPALWAEIQHEMDLRQKFGGSVDQIMDPGLWDRRREEYAARAETGAINRYDRAGLGGSSAALSGASEAVRQSNMGMEDRRLADMAKAENLDNLLSGQIRSSIMAGQAQYAGFQDEYLNAMLGLEGQKQAKDAANAQIWSSIISGVGAFGGAIAGGPAGAVAGSQIGKGAGSAFMYDSPTYGPMFGSTDLSAPDFGSSSGYGAPANYNLGYSPGYY
jgi:hypothetical protein